MNRVKPMFLLVCCVHERNAEGAAQTKNVDERTTDEWKKNMHTHNVILLLCSALNAP